MKKSADNSTSLKVVLYTLTTTVFVPASGIVLARRWGVDADLNAGQCARSCHDTGCPHDPVLPDFVAGNSGYFGDVIGWLYSFGDVIAAAGGLTRAEGYGAANLLIFCVAVPALHALLVGLSLRLCRGR